MPSNDSADLERTAHIAIIGGGPRGTGLLERLVANARALPDGPGVVLHLIDPHPPGGGRVWREDQSPLLLMNSMAEDVTMFADESVVMDGPLLPGPTLAEWAQQAVADGSRSPALEAELAAATGRTFLSRHAQSAYLDWTLRRSIDAAPDRVRVQLHAASAVDIVDLESGLQRVVLDSGDPLEADIVLLALGHLDSLPSPAEAELVSFAARHDLRYVPTGFTTDQDLSVLRAGEPVLLRGFGLAFIDLMVLLTEGRGGSYVPREGGGLDYVASGEEPVLHIGSRRGVPYHAKLGYRLVGGPAPLPHRLTAEAVDDLFERYDTLEFDRDLLPLILDDIAWGYYHELFTAHPHRVTAGWADFAARVDGGEPLDAVVAETVPAAEDRWDLPSLDKPLQGKVFDSSDELQQHLRGYLEADVARRADPAYSADHGAFNALLSTLGQLIRVLASDRLSARSLALEFPAFFGFFSYYASGPPPHRLEQLLALSRAGVVRFAGADLTVTADEVRGRFVGHSSSTGESVETTALVEARLPKPSVSLSAHPLLRSLSARGAIAEELLVGDAEFTANTGRLRVTPGDGRVVDAAGVAHPARYAYGYYTSGFSAAAFSRPRTNAIFFRQNDAAARTVLRQLGRGEPSAPPAALSLELPAQPYTSVGSR